MGDRRYVHAIDLTQNADPQRYDIGRRQRQCALERYHYLCAAIQEAYTLHRGQLFVRDELDFDRYPAYALESVSAKLHPRPDGTIHPGDIKLYVDGMVKNYKCSEGGIMYCVGDSRPFWNMVINYHSSAGTTGIKAWDRLFRKLKTSGYDKTFVPCMASISSYYIIRASHAHSILVSCTLIVLCNSLRLQRSRVPVSP